MVGLVCESGHNIRGVRSPERDPVILDVRVLGSRCYSGIKGGPGGLYGRGDESGGFRVGGGRNGSL